MNARFIGGPLDGEAFDHYQINALANIVPVFTESGNRQFLLMPPLDQCQQILGGHLTKDQVKGPLHPYERALLAGGSVEYRVASVSAFDEALKSQNQPLSGDAQARKQLFGQYADEFIERLRNTEINAATDVSIVYRYEDQHGNGVNSNRSSITPQTTIRLPGDVEGAKRLASAAHLNSLIGNINSIVRNAPSGFLSFPENPRLSLRIVGFDLVIEQA